jgi:hypothetical protein
LTAAHSQTVAFLQIGPDLQMAKILARSIRRHNPGTRILQISDTTSPGLEEVDEVIRHPRTHANVMLFRMQCFAQLPTDQPTWFLDTDMICHRPLAVDGAPQVAVCLREFNRKQIFNHRFNGMDLSEHAGRTLGAVYPYVGCATRLHQTDFWARCLRNMEALPPKFFNWYGDQEALRNIVESGAYEVHHLPESLYACLPEHEGKGPAPYISHYKGGRKPLMLERAAQDGLLDP